MELLARLVHVALEDEGLGKELLPLIEREAAHRRIGSATSGQFKSAKVPTFEEHEQKNRLYSPDLFNDATPGDRVFCHLNINKKKMYGVKAFSVKMPANTSGKVVGHVAGIVLADGEFRVGESGWKQIQRGGSKGVHAGAVGRMVKSDPPGRVSASGGVQVRYNPHQGMRWFMRQNPDTGEWDIPVATARQITLVDWKVYAKGFTDIPADKRASITSLRKDVIKFAATMPKGKTRSKILALLKR